MEFAAHGSAATFVAMRLSNQVYHTDGGQGLRPDLRNEKLGNDAFRNKHTKYLGNNTRFTSW